MTQNARLEITGILLALQGDEAGRREYNDRLFEQVYNELHRIAVDLMHQQRADHTLQPTAIVHEAYLRLVDQTRTDWQDRAHFFRTAARAMRQILVDHERRRSAAKRGGGGQKVTLNEELVAGTERAVKVLELDEALIRLSRMDQRTRSLIWRPTLPTAYAAVGSA